MVSGVQSLRLRALSSSFRLQRFGCRVESIGFGVRGLQFVIAGLRVVFFGFGRVLGFRFWAQYWRTKKKTQ